MDPGDGDPPWDAVSLFRALSYHWVMETATIDIRLNGRPEVAPAGDTLGDLLRRLGTAGPGVAAAVNDHVIRREAWETVRLSPGDRVEVIHAVGGG